MLYVIVDNYAGVAMCFDNETDLLKIGSATQLKMMALLIMPILQLIVILAQI